MGTFALVFISSFLGWINTIILSAHWSTQEYLIVLLIVGGIPGVILFHITPLYIGIWRPRIANPKILARDLFFIYIFLVVAWNVFLITVVSQMNFGYG